MTGSMDKRVGIRIRQRRWMLGLCRRQFAANLGVWPELIEAWEFGRRRVGLRWLSRIAMALEVPVDYLFEDPSAAQAGLIPCLAANAPDRPAALHRP